MTRTHTGLLLAVAAFVCAAVLGSSEVLPARAAGVMISGVTPKQGPGDAEIVVIITGTGFPIADDCPGPIIEVLFDQQSAFPLELPTRTQVKVSPPPHAIGPVDITVRNLCDQNTAILKNGYTYTGAGILSGSIPKSGGFGLFVFGGGSNDDLVRVSGCPKATATFWATNGDGEFVTFIPGAGVQAVNNAWNALFASGIPYNTALIGRCV